MNKAGGSAAFGEWAKKHIKTKVGAQAATVMLGILQCPSYLDLIIV